MKVAMFLCPLVGLVSISHALPIELVVEPEGYKMMQLPVIYHTEERSLPGEKADQLQFRQRRSPFQPFPPNVGGGGGSFQMPKPEEPRGSISGGITREKGVGTIVHGKGEGNVWTSEDGKSRVDAQGEWSKVVDGPGKAKPDYNVGAIFSHDF